MGTMNTLELQNEIKKIIGELGWSQKCSGIVNLATELEVIL